MTLRARLLAAFAYVLLLLSVALVVPFALSRVDRIDSEVEAQAASQAQLIAASASGRLRDPAELRRLVRRASRSLSARVIVVDRRGRLLADSAGTALVSTPYASRPEVASALRGRPKQGRRHSDSLNEDLLFTAEPVVSRGRTAGAVRVTQSVEAVNDRKRRDVLVLAGLAAAALALGLVVAWLLADSLSKPLRSLAEVARRIAGDDREARAEESGSREQKEVAVAFNAMTARLRRALDSQAAFVSNASHQLRTPLTGLRLRIEGAGRKSRDPGVRRDLQAAEAEVDRLSTLLSKLLILAREQKPAREAPAVSLDEVLDDAHERWIQTAEEHGRELRVMGGAGGHVRADQEELAAIVDNLMENALKYSPAGSPVEIGSEVNGGRAVVRVADAGPGIPEAEREAVFERFYRGQAAGGTGGSGLGLPIAAALARRWGGKVRLRERAGGGTVAEIELELAQVPAREAVR
jgi:signal transduction histidine kinase